MNGAERLFTGNIFIFHTFDLGDEINFDQIQKQKALAVSSLAPARHFKEYHAPLTVDLRKTRLSAHCVTAKLHAFGAISLRYKLPFEATFESLRTQVDQLYDACNAQSVKDAQLLFNATKSAISQAHFFQLRTSYVLIQVNPQLDTFDAVRIKKEFGSTIASLLRFEQASLSEYKKNEILESGVRYYRGDLILIDTDAAFIYDDEYDDLLDLFEFATMQHCELKYFDRLLDTHLNAAYGRKGDGMGWRMYVPLLGTLLEDPIAGLSKLRVDISVIIERLENSVRLSDDMYYSEVFALLVEKLDLKSWRESIEKKLEIIEDLSTIYHNKAESIRDSILSISIILLFAIEIIFGVLNLMK
jgi:hypothetical protein